MKSHSRRSSLGRISYLAIYHGPAPYFDHAPVPPTGVLVGLVVLKGRSEE